MSAGAAAGGATKAVAWAKTMATKVADRVIFATKYTPKVSQPLGLPAARALCVLAENCAWGTIITVLYIFLLHVHVEFHDDLYVSVVHVFIFVYEYI